MTPRTGYSVDMSPHVPLAIADGLILLGVILMLFVAMVMLYTQRGSGISKHPHSAPSDAPGAEAPHGPEGDHARADEILDDEGGR